MKTKSEELQEWLASNPGKNPEDWLLEVRCVSDRQRQIMAEVLAKKSNYKIPGRLPLQEEYIVGNVAICIKPKPPVKFEDPLDQKIWERNAEAYKTFLTEEEFDITFGGLQRTALDMDMPEECFANPSDPEGQWLTFLRWKYRESPWKETYASAVYNSNRAMIARNPLYSWNSPEFAEAFGIQHKDKEDVPWELKWEELKAAKNKESVYDDDEYVPSSNSVDYSYDDEDDIPFAQYDEPYTDTGIQPDDDDIDTDSSFASSTC